MKKWLSDILPINCSLKVGENKEVSGIAFDSRLVGERYLFIAVRGIHVDGHEFIDKAIENGASGVVCEVLPDNLKDGICYVICDNSTKALAKIASSWYDDPSSNLKLIGIGGTNGKTTIATLLFDLYNQLGYKTGLISTVNYRYDDKVINSTHTTPDVLNLNRILSEMCAVGCSHVFMEVSSHAIHQERLNGLKFDIGVFSNITPEHMDYHETFLEYINVKKKFFDELGEDALALVNRDDKNGLVMIQNSKAKKYTYALKRPANFKAKLISNMISGLELEIDGHNIHFRLPGLYNGYNLLAVYGVADLLGEEDKQEVLTIMSNLTGAEGRFDLVNVSGVGITGIVDYAHTPDAMNKVLEAINQLKSKDSRLITVFGCGGDRDKTKRPIMADIVSSESYLTIMTSDNPRSEDPNIIMEEMEAGVKDENLNNILLITDRKQAIKTAVKMANDRDIILLAGKGHEKYQDIKGVKTPFDDKLYLFEYLNTRVSS